MHADYKQQGLTGIAFEDVFSQDTVVGYKATGPDEGYDQYGIDTDKADEISVTLNETVNQVLEGTGVSGSFREKTYVTDYGDDFKFMDYAYADLLFIFDETSDTQAARCTEVLFRLHDLLLQFVPSQSVTYLDADFNGGEPDPENPMLARHPDGTITKDGDGQEGDDEETLETT